MGEKRAKEFIFTGRMMDADEALSYGIVNKVVPLADLREATKKMVSDLLRNSPAILKIAKMAVNKSLDLPLTVGMDYERELFAMCFGTEDQKGGRHGVPREAQACVHREMTGGEAARHAALHCGVRPGA